MRTPLSFLAALVLLAAPAWAQTGPEEGRFLSNTRQLTFEGKRAGEGYFSPDGNRICFQSEREEGNPFYQIYVLDLLSGDTARVSPGTGKTTCSFFQPGTSRMLFASTHLDPEAAAKQKAELEFRASGKTRRYSWDYDETYEIFSANQDGTDLKRLTNSPGYDAEASYSPDGKQIVFCSMRGAFPAEKRSPEDRARFERDPAYYGDIYLMNADGSDVRRLTTAPGYDGGPFFSPDGQRIIWRHFAESGMVADVFTMKLDGSDKQRVTDFQTMSWAPYFHPSGKYVIFTSNKLGFENFELFIVDAAGTKQPVRVTYTDGFDGLPVFSPDGARLCWTTNRTADKTSQLFLAKWNHEAALAALAAAPPRADYPVKTGELTKEGGSELVLSHGPRTAASSISKESLSRIVHWLAAPEREGRATGTPGAQASAEYLADELKKAGVQPLGESYFLPFEFRAGEKVIDGKNLLKLTTAEPVGEKVFKVHEQYRPLAFTENGEADAEVVFAGYGLSAPEAAGQPRYNSYDGLEVKGKIVLFFRYVPEGVEQARRAHLNRYAGLRYKVMMARERGAVGVLVVTGPNSPGAGEVLAIGNDGSNADSGLPALSIDGQTAEALLAPSGKSLKDLQTGLDTENPHAAGGFVLPKVKVKLAAAVEHLRKTDRNVVGMIKGETDEYVVVGAHYDHLGRGGSSSLAKSGEEKQIHPGADDNASGSAVVLALAREFGRYPYLDHVVIKTPGQPDVVSKQTQRGIIFCFWSGEEMGLLGSAAFVGQPPVPLEKIAAYINFDMVGRLREDKLSMQAVGSSKLWRKELEKRNVAAGFSLALQDDPYLPTDVTSFYPKRIPVLNFFTGAHEDYHRPSDTPDKVNYEGMERIAKFAEAIISDVAYGAERPDYARVEKIEKEGGSRDTLRAYLGSIPDYTQEVKGVKLQGVRGGSPAEKGGLQGGDVIVEFAGQKIANIYDYTYALDAVKIGTPVKITVERGGKRVEVTVTPEARK
ncbi:MAG TPA: M28 family peptidase [Chthoniobacteraceae bacterium]|jgi:Tol biopolymer transport system component|nr:M28 family peptidase [Chthoniobacteraceae bacterium]